MPTVYLSKELYDKLVKLNKDVNEFIDKTVTEALNKLEKEEEKEKRR